MSNAYMKPYVLLAVALLFNGVANVLMKAGMREPQAVPGLWGMVRHYLTSWPVMAGLFLFALNIIAYTQALAKLPLSVAYPIMVSLSGLIVILGSQLWFKESITWIQVMGFFLIIGGVICVAR
ncbi:MAG: EamA family transporter [Myxococcota bacterium]|jgi:multidrug transporter EmrE-like cation transporter|nr:EamA family transporter [Myxococcota bacterium]